MSRWFRFYDEALDDPVRALHICCTMALRPRSKSLIPVWSKAYRYFKDAGFSMAQLDDAIEALEENGVFSKDFPTFLTRRAEMPGRLPQNEWAILRAKVFQRDGFICSYCSSTEKLECDHIIPISKGGSNEMTNLTTACQTCNRSKGDKLVEEWQQ